MLAVLHFASILLTGLMAGFLAWYALRQRDLPGVRPYAGLALCICLLAFSESLSMLSPSSTQALFWFNVRHIFTATLPVFFLLFVLEYNGYRDWLSRRILAFAFIIPVLTQVMLWSNSLHGWWVKQEVGFHQSGWFWLAETSARIPGLWFMVNSFYCLILLLTGIMVVFVTAWNKGGLYRVQGLLLSAAALIALVVTLIPLFNLLPQAEFNHFTPGLGLSLLLTALAVFRSRFRERLPATQAGSRTQKLAMQSQRSQTVLFLIYFMMAAGIVAFAYISYQNYERHFRQRMEDQLLTIANLKVSELENWRAERMGNAQAIHRNPAFALLAARCLENPADTQAQAQMQAWLDSLRNAYHYDRIYLLDTAGLERISSPATRELVEAHVIQEEADILNGGQVIFLDFHRETEDGSIHLALLVPIYAELNSHPLGLVVLRIDPNVDLYPSIQQWPIPSTSSETLLIRREGAEVLFLNDLRFQADAALTLHFSLENMQLPAVMASLGQEGLVEGVDYRGVPVIAGIRAVPDSPWFLVAKMDAAEVYSPLRERLWQTLVFFGALLVTSGGGLSLVWWHQRVGYYRQQVETAEALRVSEDNFRLAFNTSPDSLVITRLADGMFVLVNKRFEQVLGYGQEEIAGKTPSEINIWKDPEDRRKIVEELQATSEVRSYEAALLTRNGEIFGLISASKIEMNGVPHSLFIIHDITERKQAEAKLLASQAELLRLLTEADQSRRILLSILEDQQQIGTALQESEQKYRLLVDNASEAIIVGQDGILKFVNHMTCDLTGYSEQELILQPLSKFIHPDDRSMVMEHYLRLIKGVVNIPRYTFRLMARGGKTKWVEISAVLIEWEGKPATLNFLTDITERKQVELVREAVYTISQAAVTESLEDFYLTIHRALSNLMPMDNFYIALYDPDADLISFPYSVDQHDAYAPPHKPGRGLTEYVLHTGRPLLVDRQAFEKLVQQGEDLELVGVDSVIWLGVPLKVGAKTFGVIAVQSYTEGVRFGTAEKGMLEFVSTQVANAIERKLIQQRIIDALGFNNTLIDASTMGISAYDASGQCILANEAIARMFDATREQVLGENYHSIESWKKSGLLEAACEAASSSHETRHEIHSKTTAGNEIWLDCHFTPFVSNGESHLLLTAVDISIRMQNEVALSVFAANLERSNRDLQEFAYVASHDLQEPLRKVMAFGDRLAQKYGDALDQTGLDYLKRMRDASQRMQNLINDLLIFSRVSSRAQSFTEVNLNELTQDVLSDLESQIERAKGRVETGDLPSIEADPTQMRQLLQNLIGNALKFHDEKRSPLIKISAQIKDKECQISVQDNGIGFNIQYLDRIFKPFQRLHNREEYEGSGMGLAICRRIAERHGGRLTATSTPGEGSTFIVSLPIHQTEEKNAYQE